MAIRSQHHSRDYRGLHLKGLSTAIILLLFGVVWIVLLSPVAFPGPAAHKTLWIIELGLMGTACALALSTRIHTPRTWHCVLLSALMFSVSLLMILQRNPTAGLLIPLTVGTLVWYWQMQSELSPTSALPLSTHANPNPVNGREWLLVLSAFCLMALPVARDWWRDDMGADQVWPVMVASRAHWLLYVMWGAHFWTRSRALPAEYARESVALALTLAVLMIPLFGIAVEFQLAGGAEPRSKIHGLGIPSQLGLVLSTAIYFSPYRRWYPGAVLACIALYWISASHGDTAPARYPTLLVLSVAAATLTDGRRWRTVLAGLNLLAAAALTAEAASPVMLLMVTGVANLLFLFTLQVTRILPERRPGAQSPDPAFAQRLAPFRRNALALAVLSAVLFGASGYLVMTGLQTGITDNINRGVQQQLEQIALNTARQVELSLSLTEELAARIDAGLLDPDEVSGAAELMVRERAHLPQGFAAWSFERHGESDTLPSSLLDRPQLTRLTRWLDGNRWTTDAGGIRLDIDLDALAPGDDRTDQSLGRHLVQVSFTPPQSDEEPGVDGSTLTAKANSRLTDLAITASYPRVEASALLVRALYEAALALGLLLGTAVYRLRLSALLVREQKESLDQLEMTRSIIMHSPSPVALLDANLTWEAVNTALRKLLKLGTASDAIEHPFSALRPDSALRAIAVATLTDGTQRDAQLSITTADGSLLETECHFTRVKSLRGYSLVLEVIDLSSLRLDLRQRLLNEVHHHELKAKAALDGGRARFVRTVGEELQHPLNRIALLCQEQTDDIQLAEAQDVLARMLDATRSLDRLVRDLTDRARFESGQMQLRNEAFGVIPMLGLLEQSLSEEAVANGVSLSVANNLPADEDGFMGDELRLHQILRNLVSNALKFTPAGGEARIECTAVETASGTTTLRFDIIDSGIGIPVEAQKRVFEPFFQLEDGNTRKYGGAGLGLTIARSLATSMNGSLELVSSDATGSVFRLELELQRCPSEQLETWESAVTNKSERVLEGMRVLVVTGKNANHNTLLRTLQNGGAGSVTVVGFDELGPWLAAHRHYVELMLAEMPTPVDDSIRLLSALRNNKTVSLPPIVAMCGLAADDGRLPKLQSLVSEVLHTPVAPDVLLMTMINVGRRSLAMGGAGALRGSQREQKWPEIEGIEAETSKSMLAGNQALFIKLLDQMVRSFKHVRHLISRLDPTDNNSALLASLNTLMLSAKMLGARELQNASQRLIHALQTPHEPSAGRVAEVERQMRRLEQSASATLQTFSGEDRRH